MDAAGNFAGSVQALNDSAALVKNMAVDVHAKAAHRVVGRRCKHPHLQRNAFKLVRSGVVGTVRLFVCIADEGSPAGLVYGKAAFRTGHQGMVIVLDFLPDHCGVGSNAKLLEEVAELLHRARVLAPGNIGVPERRAGRTVGIRTGDCLSVVCNLNHHALYAVVLNAVHKLCKRKHIAFAGFVHVAFSAGGVQVDCIVTAAECQLSVVHPGDGHKLRVFKTGGSSARSFAHRDAVAHERGTVRRLGAL